MRLSKWGLGIVLGVALLAAGATFGHLRGWWVEPVTSAALSALLRPHDRVFAPEGDGPFPTLILIHGCGGLSEGRLRTARELRDLGYAVIAVNSLASRGLAAGADSPMCAGSRVLGPERAGDVIVSLADARRLPFVDPERIALLGFSHGGWTLMELLAFDPPHSLPATLLDSSGDGLAGVRGVVLVYPYCGFASLGTRWQPRIPTLFLLGAEDRMAEPEPCLESAVAMAAAGHPVRAHVFPGARHGFDVAGTARHPNPGYQEQAAKETRRRVREFLVEVMQ